MQYHNSPHPTGAHLRAVDFTEPVLDPFDVTSVDFSPVDAAPAVHADVGHTHDDTVVGTDSIATSDAVIPTPRGHRQHVVPPNLDDYPDMTVVTPDPASRAWVLPTGENSGFSTLVDVADDPELGAELSRLDPTRSLLFHGALIGMITTRRSTHICDFPHGYASTSLRCAGCRWFETRVFRLDDVDSGRVANGRYVLHYVGRSIVPGEVDLPRHELVRSGHEVVEAYTVRRRNEPPFITKPGARVLAQAAKYDPDVEDAYVNRATA